MNQKPPPTTSEIILDLSGVPPLLDANGVKTYIANLGRTLLYHLASTGEIQSVSLGMGRKGKRLFVTQSIVEWIRRRAAEIRPPAMGAKAAQGDAADRPIEMTRWRKAVANPTPKEA